MNESELLVATPESEGQEDRPFSPAVFGLNKGTNFDFLLYILGGAGLFVLASLLLSQWLLKQGFIGADGSINLNLWTVIAAVGTNIVFIGGAPFLWGVLRKKNSWAQWGLLRADWDWRYLFWGSFIAIVIMPLRGAVGWLVEAAIAGDFSSVEAREDLILGGGMSWGSFFVVLIGVGILAPLAEEFYFRGLLHTWLRQRLGMWGTILTSSVLFGLAHIDSVGVTAAAFLMGIVMAYIFERSRSLYVPIIIHVVNNSVSVLLSFGIMWASEAGLLDL